MRLKHSTSYEMKNVAKVLESIESDEKNEQDSKSIRIDKWC